MPHLFIQFSKKILKNIFKTFLVLLTTVLILEFITRLIIFIPTNINVFKYGFKKTVSLDVVDLSKLEISIYDFDKKKIRPKKNFSNNLIWIFGGSTTHGYNCEQHQSSSWPEEIHKIRKDFDFKNFSFDGADTDQQLTLLLKEISINKPKVILWSNKFNTDNILGKKNYKNKKILKYEFQDSNKTSFLKSVKEIDITLKSNLLFYSLLDKIIDRVIWKLNLKKKRIKPSKKDYFFAIKNFEINTIKAIEASINHDVKEFFIISLFYDDTDFDELEKYRFFLYKKTINKIKDIYNSYVKIIDLDDAFKSVDKKNLLCDFLHQTSKGNKLQAEYIIKELTQKSDVINE